RLVRRDPSPSPPRRPCARTATTGNHISSSDHLHEPCLLQRQRGASRHPFAMNEMSSSHGDSRTAMAEPDREVSVREVFGVDSDMKVPAFSKADERVPD